jgi:asparagine synthase (glutamine-hydrolysing)
MHKQMCGIFAYYNKDGVSDCNCTSSNISHRGPDETRTVNPCKTVQLVFHRLAINGLAPAAGQPFFTPDHKVYLLANGEIYNHVDLEKRIASPSSGSDCEVILHLYLKYGISETVKMLDGEFAFCIVDLRIGKIFTGRDHVGVRSLYYLKAPGKFAVCSELKGLPVDEFRSGDYRPVDQFPNRHYGEYDMNTEQFRVEPYDTFFMQNPDFKDEGECGHIAEIRARLTNAVKKRLMCDRKTSSGGPAIGCFLSGGFDSSLVSALAQNFLDSPIHTFSIGFSGAPDLIAAREVADYIGSIHHEHIVTPEYMLSLIPEVIRQVESYDITSVRASTFMYALSKYIREEFPEIVVLLSGEGPDEASGSYMYFYNSPDHESFRQETMRLLDDLRYFDCLRCDKSTAGHSLEVRVPFLDGEFLEYYMIKVHPKFKLIPRSKDGSGGVEKYILRKSFSEFMTKNGTPILPERIIWRPKEAMSDGVSLHDEGLSWFQIIQSHISTKKRETQFSNPFLLEFAQPGVQLEREWYRDIFNYYYPGCSHLVPYYWLPRWSYGSDGRPVEDPSARVLSVYRS